MFPNNFILSVQNNLSSINFTNLIGFQHLPCMDPQRFHCTCLLKLAWNVKSVSDFKQEQISHLDVQTQTRKFSISSWRVLQAGMCFKLFLTSLWWCTMRWNEPPFVSHPLISQERALAMVYKTKTFSSPLWSPETSLQLCCHKLLFFSPLANVRTSSKGQCEPDMCLSK